MSLAKKLKEVVAANFVEISRQDKEAEPAKETGLPAARHREETLGWDHSAAPAPRGEEEDDLLLPTQPEAGLSESQYAAAQEVMAATIADVRASQEEAAAAEPQEEEPVAADPLSLVGESGTVDFDAVFARSDVPRSATFTAEQALTMLLSMPADLPLRVKRLTVKATLDAVGQAVGAAPADIVADAERKKDGLERYIDEVTGYAAQMRTDREGEIATLRARIADIENEVVSAEKKRDEAILSTRNRIDQFDQVVAFFTAEGSDVIAEAGQESPHEESELPPFLQEEAVMRLLGIQSEGEAAETAPEVAESVA